MLHYPRCSIRTVRNRHLRSVNKFLSEDCNAYVCRKIPANRPSADPQAVPRCSIASNPHSLIEHQISLAEGMGKMASYISLDVTLIHMRSPQVKAQVSAIFAVQLEEEHMVLWRSGDIWFFLMSGLVFLHLEGRLCREWILSSCLAKSSLNWRARVRMAKI